MIVNNSMGIQTSLLDGYQQVENTGNASAPPRPPPPPAGDDDSTDISSIGQVLSQISEEEKTALQDFIDSVQQASESGELDTATLAEDAPEFLQSLAQEQGVDLEELINEFASMAPPPPPTALSSDEMETITAYHQEILAAVEDGTYDAESFAESAPDAVVAMAEARGEELEDLISWMSENDVPEEAGSPPPPPAMAAGPGMPAGGYLTEENHTAGLAAALTRFAAS